MNLVDKLLLAVAVFILTASYTHNSLISMLAFALAGVIVMTLIPDPDYIEEVSDFEEEEENEYDDEEDEDEDYEDDYDDELYNQEDMDRRYQQGYDDGYAAAMKKKEPDEPKK